MAKKITTFTIAVSILLALTLLAGCSDTTAPKTTTTNSETQETITTIKSEVPAKEFEIESFNSTIDGAYAPRFSLKEITASKGDLVRIKVNTTSGKHNFKIDEFDVFTDTPEGEVTVIEFTADQVGEFIYYCAKGKHRELGQWGTIIVKDAENALTVTDKKTSLGKAPAFEATTIKGVKVSLDSYLSEKKPLVIYFMASWCPICATNWPTISEAYPEYKDRLNLVAIGIDPTDTTEVMKKLSEEKGFRFPVVPGNPQIMLDFGVKSQATTVGVDLKGNIVFMKEKQSISADGYRELFEQLLN